ncbi:hypothetical protein LAZ67_3004314 [Cordylochernes scorpioides]|uniref:Uncharacterized protein n=1 Tax=Cordylochernes scorpioides TaxID=51811 RepID=A0ABY6KCN4_9ARAC|nr:hypothetical protein LAZ67_3004314 [Cordylochernes scorpioides]
MRQEFAAWIIRQIDIDENWLSNVLWTDDAHFYLKGEFNIQNCLILATENPRIFTEILLNQPRVTVLAKALSEITFMKDGGPPHISRGAKQLLKDTFGENRVISRHFIYQWPPRSPDLTPCDFCLWGYIKSCVYRCWPTTLAMLKASIRWHVLSISTDMLFNAVHSVGLFLALATGGCLASYPSMSPANSYGVMAQQHSMQQKEEPPKPYQYSYEVDDGYNNRHHHKEESDAYGAKKGSYGYTNAEGLYRNVDYVADKDGYRAYVKSNEPGVGPEASADVVLKVKPVPEAVQNQAMMAAYQSQVKDMTMNEYYNSNMGGKSSEMMPRASPMKMAYQPEMNMKMPSASMMIAPMEIAYQPKMKMEQLYAPMMAQASPMKMGYQPKMMNEMPSKSMMAQMYPMKMSYQADMEMPASSLKAQASPMEMGYQSEMKMGMPSVPMMAQASPMKMAYQPKSEMPSSPMMAHGSSMKMAYQPKMKSEMPSSPMMSYASPMEMSYQPKMEMPASSSMAQAKKMGYQPNMESQYSSMMAKAEPISYQSMMNAMSSPMGPADQAMALSSSPESRTVGLFLALATGGCLASYPSMSPANSYSGMAQQYGMQQKEEPPKPYQYSYEVDDGYNNRHHHKEESDAYGAKKGSYGYTNAEGLYRNVDYVADKDGYRAYVKSNEPGVGPEASADVDLKVKPVPEAVQNQAMMAAYQSQMKDMSMNEYYNSNMGGKSIEMMSQAYQPEMNKQILSAPMMISSMKMAYQPKMKMEQLSAPMMAQASPMKMGYQPKMMNEMPSQSMMAQMYPMKMSYQADMEMPTSSLKAQASPMKMGYQSKMKMGIPSYSMMAEASPMKMTYQLKSEMPSSPMMAHGSPMKMAYQPKMKSEISSSPMMSYSSPMKMSYQPKMKSEMPSSPMMSYASPMKMSYQPKMEMPASLLKAQAKNMGYQPKMESQYSSMMAKAEPMSYQSMMNSMSSQMGPADQAMALSSSPESRTVGYSYSTNLAPAKPQNTNAQQAGKMSSSYKMSY